MLTTPRLLALLRSFKYRFNICQIIAETQILYIPMGFLVAGSTTFWMVSHRRKAVKRIWLEPPVNWRKRVWTAKWLETAATTSSGDDFNLRALQRKGFAIERFLPSHSPWNILSTSFLKVWLSRGLVHLLDRRGNSKFLTSAQSWRSKEFSTMFISVDWTSSHVDLSNPISACDCSFPSALACLYLESLLSVPFFSHYASSLVRSTSPATE